MTRRGRKRRWQLTQAQKCAMGRHIVTPYSEGVCLSCGEQVVIPHMRVRVVYPLDHDKIPQAR